MVIEAPCSESAARAVRTARALTSTASRTGRPEEQRAPVVQHDRGVQRVAEPLLSSIAVEPTIAASAVV